MEQGQVVTIFEDPVTKKKPEGEAVLLELMWKDRFPPYMERWKVSFTGEDDVYERNIMP
jgi:hypothetical protein